MSVDSPSTPRSLQPQSEARRAPRYFLENVVFQVEDCLFSVPKWYFTKNSSIFRDMFSVPTPGGKPVDGSSEDQPLVLEGVKARDFEALIGLMYPMLTYSLAGARYYPPEPESLEGKIEYYTSILELSRKWYFHGLHAYAVKKLTDHLNPVDKILLGKRFEVPSWVVEGLRDFVNRDAIVDQEEVEKLGWEVTLGIVTLREHRMRSRRGYHEPLPVDYFSNIQVQPSTVREIFDISTIDRAYTDFYADANPDP